MSLAGYEIAWTPPAKAHFYKLHPWVAMVVDRAVIHFVERGEGLVEHVPPFERLRAGFYDVLLSIHPKDRLVIVVQFYRARAR